MAPVPSLLAVSPLWAAYPRHGCRKASPVIYGAIGGPSALKMTARNTEAIREGLRIVSPYPIDLTLPAKGYGANVFWIITEADRNVTTFLLPDEY